MEEVLEHDRDDVDQYTVQRMEWVHAARKREQFIKYSNARDAENKLRCAELEEDNPFLETLYDDEGPCQYTEYQQYLRIIREWLRCVRSDESYSNYCDAIELKKDPYQIAPPQSFIHEFYKDWGDVRDIFFDDELDWIKSNYHLFMPAWIEAVEPEDEHPQGVTVAVVAPDGTSKVEYVNKIFTAIYKQYEKNGELPKYQVRAKIFSATSQRLHVSSYIFDQHKKKVNEKEQTNYEITKKYLMDWKIFQGMQGKNFNEVDRGNISNSIANNKKSIEQWIETYRLCKANAISKFFPPKI